jgi:hypothetical protein
MSSGFRENLIQCIWNSPHHVHRQKIGKPNNLKVFGAIKLKDIVLSVVRFTVSDYPFGIFK